ncbi:hypothetical protein M0802_004913 [Mischocyttarus mexicanus]|nr:hypothetical protein M0802_004913 [Mischocyttarus mexicanus]
MNIFVLVINEKSEMVTELLLLSSSGGWFRGGSKWIGGGDGDGGSTVSREIRISTTCLKIITEKDSPIVTESGSHHGLPPPPPPLLLPASTITSGTHLSTTLSRRLKRSSKD